MEKTSERTNVTVSIRDLLLYLCSRWRVLIICLIIGAILGGAYSGYKSLKSGSPVSREEKAMSIYESMSETDRTTVQNNITTFIHYLNQYEYYSEYDKHSLFQKLNPDTAKVGVLTYYVNASGDGVILDSIVNAYAANTVDEKFAKEVAGEFGITEEEAFYYYNGIVRIETTSTQSSAAPDSMFLVRIYGEDEEFIARMMELVKKSVDRVTDSVSEGNSSYKATLVGETIKKNDDTYIYDSQEKVVTNKQKIIKNCTDFKDGLDSNVLTVVEYLIPEQYDGEYLDVFFPEIPETKTGSSFHISKKWLIAGAAGLFILAILAIVIKYLVKGVVRCYDDIEYTYGIQVLGTYDDPKTASKEHKFKLDKWLKSLRIKRKSQDRESSAALIAKKLQLLAKRNDIQNICVAIGPDVDTDETFMSDVAEKADGINVTVASNILRNADAITKILEADGVVLLEQMDKSRFSVIDQERVMCAGNNIKILGAIVAE